MLRLSSPLMINKGVQSSRDFSIDVYDGNIEIPNTVGNKVVGLLYNQHKNSSRKYKLANKSFSDVKHLPVADEMNETELVTV